MALLRYVRLGPHLTAPHREFSTQLHRQKYLTLSAIVRTTGPGEGWVVAAFVPDIDSGSVRKDQDRECHIEAIKTSP